jgi:ferritin-like metal-binding protein YciE
MKLNTLQDLYLHQLLDLQSAEKQLVRALPKMVKGAANEDLSEALSDHLAETKGHVERLAQILETMPGGKKAMKCKGMEGLLEEGSEILEEEGAPEVKDAGIIGAAQRVEHYEIAAYGTACTLAKALGDQKGAQLLAQTLAEEKAADQKLTDIAMSSVNVEAANA